MKRLILAGGGHVHVHLIANAKRLQEQGVEILVIQKTKRHYYSGMGPGILSENYTSEEISFSVEELAKKNDIVFVEGAIENINPETQNIIVDEGGVKKKYRYDILSCNLGSKCILPAGVTETSYQENIFVSKPIENLWEGKKRLDELKEESGKLKVLVIGGGPASLEIAGNIASYLKKYGKNFEIKLYAKEVLKGFPKKVQDYAKKALMENGIIQRKNNLKRVEGDKFIIDNGHMEDYDLAFVNIGVKGTEVFKNSGLKVASDDTLVVNKYLQSAEYENIFGAGDCITIEGEKLARVGVHAVRESGVLLDNIENYLLGKELKEYKVDNNFLMIINTGNKRGILIKNNFILAGKLAYLIKDFIDRRFMNKYK